MKPFAAKVDELLQLGQTQRWHTEAGRTLKTQDVAQHVYNIQWLLCVLSEGRLPSAALLLHALAHDAGERYSGDVPSPAKRAMGLGPAFDAYESEKLARLGIILPPLSDAEQKLLDIADCLEGCFFCAREAALGNRLIRKCYTNFVQYLLQKVDVNDVVQRNLTDMVQNDFREHFGGQ